MPNNTFEIKTKLNIVEFTQKCYENGYGAIIPIVDGVEHPELMMGYTSENDKESGMKLLRDAIESINDISEVMPYLFNAMHNVANNIHPDIQINVDGLDVMLSYSQKKAYLLDGTEIVNANDINTDDKDIIKVVLTERVKNFVK